MANRIGTVPTLKKCENKALLVLENHPLKARLHRASLQAASWQVRTRVGRLSYVLFNFRIFMGFKMEWIASIFVDFLLV